MVLKYAVCKHVFLQLMCFVFVAYDKFNHYSLRKVTNIHVHVLFNGTKS